MHCRYHEMVCKPCGPGCDECVDGRSCRYAHNWTVRTVLLIMQCITMGCTLPLFFFTIYNRDVKVNCVESVFTAWEYSLHVRTKYQKFKASWSSLFIRRRSGRSHGVVSNRWFALAAIFGAISLFLLDRHGCTPAPDLALSLNMNDKVSRMAAYANSL